MSVISDVLKYSRLAFDLRGFLSSTINVEESEQVITAALRNRERNFLNFVQKGIYQNPESPYIKLLQMAGCEFGDMASLVNKEGIEATMRKLLAEGVYLSWEEFKGKKEVVRGGRHFQFKEAEFDNPFLARNIENSSGGSRSPGTRIMMNFDRFAYQAAHTAVAFAAHGIWGRPIIIWMPILPSGAGLAATFWLAKTGNLPVKWFSPVESKTIKPALAKRLATYYTVYASRLFGAAFPKPEYVSFEQAYKVADCLAEVLKKGQGCVLWTFANSAVRVSQAALEKKLDLSDVTFIVGGEPLTAAKAKEIKATGANAVSVYVVVEVGLIGFGCAGQTVVSDDVHHCKDIHAVIQRRREIPSGTASVDAFLFTSLLSKSPKILLNVESGDYGVMETRHCGCELEELGLTDHIYNIRSFDKLTGEGMTFIGTDLLRIIEEVLPAKFGGASADYQMVEDEDERGHTRLNILASPEVGEIDEGKLVKTILAELSKGKDTQRMMAEMWSQAEILRVKRQRPFVTAAGKLLPLHIQMAKTDGKKEK
ncbi:MAG: hypothetical protein GH159_00325 [Dehalococcoidia bacterium]|nr:hypothetical protein [Dehalococcoidia bacterium]